jgi:hypothetical protein
MNNLKKYAGLLNEVAPEGEFLAYINNDEEKMLREAGGKGILTQSGIRSYRGEGGYQGGSTGSSSSSSSSSSSGSSSSSSGGGGGGGGRQDAESQYGADSVGSYDSSQNQSGREQSYGNGNNNTVDPGFQKALKEKATSNFDYETEAYTGLGKIESNFYNDETGQFTTTQSPGVIPAVDYQTSNIGAYLDNPNVSDKDKTDFLGRLKAISNSDLVGTNVDGIEDQFIVDNLDGSLNSILDQTKYSKYTNNIDEVAKTFESDFKNTPLSTVTKSGGVLGTFFRGVTDNYKNNKAMDLLGYTGSTIKYNPDGSGNFNYGGGFLTGNASQGERDAVNQLTPFAADAIGGTTTQPSMVNQYFSNMGSNLGVSSAYMDTYNAAKANIANTLNLQPNNQQYGYGNTFNDTYARSMTSANPFFDELTNQGLI